MRGISIASVAGLLASCVPNVDEDYRRCPCGPGWVCFNGFCVKEELVCPGVCGDNVVCPGEVCDDGDTDDCTPACNATCSGQADPDDPMCVEPDVYFSLLADEITEIPPTGAQESMVYVLHVLSSHPYYKPVDANFGVSNELNDGTLAVTPEDGRVRIPAGETVSSPISLRLFRDPVSDARVRSVYVALLAAEPGRVTAPSLFTLDVRHVPVPYVVSTYPVSGATGIPFATYLEVEFSREMDTDATLAAITIEPSIEGQPTWDPTGTRLRFEPTELLEHQTIYEVTIGQGATSATGVPAYGESFWFETFGPKDVALIMVSLSPLR